MSKERELLRISSHSEARIPTHFIYELQELLAKPEQEPFAWAWTRNYEGGGYTNKVFQMRWAAEEYAKDSENLKYPDLVRPLYLKATQGGNNDR